MSKLMYNELEEKTYYNPGDIVTIKHKIDNAPKMWVIEKVVRSLYNKETNEKENIFLGIKCRWFDKNQELQEALFSSKDLQHI